MISNSYKFTSSGSISITITRSREEGVDGVTTNYLEFIVRDTGIGISERDQRNLFQLFSTVNKTKFKFNAKGTGLGLTITKKLVTLLGGKIELKSQENLGTSVRFNIAEVNNIRRFEGDYLLFYLVLLIIHIQFQAVYLYTNLIYILLINSILESKNENSVSDISP